MAHTKLTIDDFTQGFINEDLGGYNNLMGVYHYYNDQYEFFIQKHFTEWYVSGFKNNRKKKCVISDICCKTIDECLEVINKFLSL